MKIYEILKEEYIGRKCKISDKTPKEILNYYSKNEEFEISLHSIIRKPQIQVRAKDGFLEEFEIPSSHIMLLEFDLIKIQ
ncbi:hypothetical protein UT300013_32710 [Paraclostridium sordellii]